MENPPHLVGVRYQGDAIIALAKNREVHYPIADHRQPVRRAESTFALPVTEAACAEVISLPCHPALSPAQIGRVTEAVRAFFSQGGAC